MPHRGRLNLLTDLLNFNPTALFHKVKGNSEFPDDIPATGDVLSHIGTSIRTAKNTPDPSLTTIRIAATVNLDYGKEKPIHVSMLHNPSHLEAANPVALGKARAKQMYLYESGLEQGECYIGDRVMCVQMHGDAAFCGQVSVSRNRCLRNRC